MTLVVSSRANSREFWEIKRPAAQQFVSRRVLTVIGQAPRPHKSNRIGGGPRESQRSLRISRRIYEGCGTAVGLIVRRRRPSGPGVRRPCVSPRLDFMVAATV